MGGCGVQILMNCARFRHLIYGMSIQTRGTGVICNCFVWMLEYPQIGWILLAKCSERGSKGNASQSLLDGECGASLACIEKLNYLSLLIGRSPTVMGDLKSDMFLEIM